MALTLVPFAQQWSRAQTPSAVEPFLGEWVEEHHLWGTRQYTQKMIAVKDGNLVESGIDFGIQGSTSRIIVPLQGTATTKSYPKDPGMLVGNLQVDTNSMRFQGVTRFPDSTITTTEQYTLDGPDRVLLHVTFVHNTSGSGGTPFTIEIDKILYRPSSAPEAFHQMKSRAQLEELYRVAKDELEVVVGPYKRIKGWDSSESQSSNVNSLLNKTELPCDPSLNPSIRNREKCLKQQLPKMEATLTPFKTWLVKNQLALQHITRLSSSSAHIDVHKYVGRAWAQLAAGYRDLGMTAKAKSEFDEALSAGINLARALDEIYVENEHSRNQYAAISAQVNASSTRASSWKSWVNVLGSAVDVYAASKGVNTVGGPLASGRQNRPPIAGSPSAPATQTMPGRPPSLLAVTSCGTLETLGFSYPATGNAGLERLRTEALRSHVGQAISQAQAQGLTKSGAISQLRQQVSLAAQQKTQAESCIRQSAKTEQFGTSVINALRSRQFNSIPAADNMLTSCIDSFVTADLQQEVNQATALHFERCWR